MFYATHFGGNEKKSLPIPDLPNTKIIIQLDYWFETQIKKIKPHFLLKI